jgi:hypothetical protein
VLDEDALEKLRIELLLPAAKHLIQLWNRIWEYDLLLLILLVEIVSDIERDSFKWPLKEGAELFLDLIYLLHQAADAASHLCFKHVAGFRK